MSDLNSRSHYRDVDVIVAGGGPSGVSAAVHAARAGARTVLVERYGRLGGAAVTSTVNPLMGGVTLEFRRKGQTLRYSIRLPCPAAD